jgi:hypothetical protein
VVGIGKCSVEDQLLCVFAFDLESGRKLWTGCGFTKEDTRSTCELQLVFHVLSSLLKRG